MKKVRVSLWVDGKQAERLAEHSRKSKVLISDCLNEAIDDLLKKQDKQPAKETKRKRAEQHLPGAQAGIGGG